MASKNQKSRRGWFGDAARHAHAGKLGAEARLRKQTANQ